LYGLGKIQARQVAHQFAVYLYKKIPPSWENNELDGEDWLKGFRHRNKTLSLRSHEVRQTGA